jgi:protein gp37
MIATKIAWTERTWNPVAGCSVISPGCTNCYAMRRARRIELQQHGGKYAGLTRKTSAGPVWTGTLRLWEPALDDIRRWPAVRVFVNSMSDLAHEDMPVEWFGRIWRHMVEAQRERGLVFQVLTKRPANLLKLLAAIGVRDPAPGIWLGVSAEDARRWDERVPALCDLPTIVRWISAEPQLGLIDRDLAGIAWLVQGGESAAKRAVRPFDLAWARLMRDRCRAAETAYFLKQLGTVAIENGRAYRHRRSGVDVAEWPVDLQIQEYPSEPRISLLADAVLLSSARRAEPAETGLAVGN